MFETERFRRADLEIQANEILSDKVISRLKVWKIQVNGECRAILSTSNQAALLKLLEIFLELLDNDGVITISIEYMTENEFANYDSSD